MHTYSENFIKFGQQKLTKIFGVTVLVPGFGILLCNSTFDCCERSQESCFPSFLNTRQQMQHSTECLECF